MSHVTTPFSTLRFFGTAPGPHLLVTGAVHGNEPCGPAAIYQIIDALQTGAITLTSGSVTFVPVVNPKAFALKERAGDRDLNRNLKRYDAPQVFEDHIANALTAVMENCDVLLDIHSFRTQGGPFIFIGPEDNDADLQPFAHADAELRFAQSLGFDTMVYGWLDTYDQYVTDQNAFLDQHPHVEMIRSQRHFGIGTTEYFRSIGKYGVTVECGNHLDPQAVPIAHRAIMGALACLGLIDSIKPVYQPFQSAYRLTAIPLREHADDRFPKPWRLFDPVIKGDVLGIRHTGEKITARADGAVIFSYDDAEVGNGWMYIAERATRGTENSTQT